MNKQTFLQPETVTLAVVGDKRKEKRYEELTFADDFMFGKIMSDKQNCKRLLEILLNIDPDTEIADPVAQSSLRISPNAKAITVDVRTYDDYNDYDVESQKQNHPNLPKRARYYQAMMDINFLEPGKDYEELKNNYIIFICLRDLFKKGLPIYTFQNRCAEDTAIILGDCTTKIFLNAAKSDTLENKELKAFMEYVKTGEAHSEYTATIDRLVKASRENPRWRREYMDAMMEVVRQEKREREAREEGMTIGIANGERKNAFTTAQRMIATQLGTPQQIADVTGLSLADVQQLAQDTVTAL